MNETIFTDMKSAIDAIAHSPHPANKVAACLIGHTAQNKATQQNDTTNKSFKIISSNYWPPLIENTFGHNTKIGNSSGTIHAETACILSAPAKTEGAKLFVTDPPCPNCMKNSAEAGITHIYIDHKGFDKDFAKRRGHHFENMSMRICEKAGINLFKINRKAETITAISEPKPNYHPNNENPALIHPTDSPQTDPEILLEKINETKALYTDKPFAICLAKNTQKKTFYIIAEQQPTIGYTTTDIEEDQSEKYSFILQPTNRLLMNAARHGLNIIPETLYTSRTPTSRELVNLIGAGLTTLTIGDTTQSRDEESITALKQLTKHKIITLK